MLTKVKLNKTEEKNTKKVTSHFGNIARARHDAMYRTAKPFSRETQTKTTLPDNDSKNHETKFGGEGGGTGAAPKCAN